MAVLSALAGLAPNVVEDDRSRPIDCGAALFHGAARPSPRCDAVADPWRGAAVVGLVLAVVLAAVAAVLLVRAARRPQISPGAPRSG